MKKNFYVLIVLLPTVLLNPLAVQAVQSIGGGYILHSQLNNMSGIMAGNNLVNFSGAFRLPGPPSTVPPPQPGPVGGGVISVEPTQPGIEQADNNAEGIAESPLPESASRADIFPDNRIDVLDFNALMVDWGKPSSNTEAGNCNGKFSSDINCDGDVGIVDFNLLMVYWSI